MASSNSIANNTAVRLGAAALLSGVLIYWIWASTQSSSEPSTPEGASAKGKKKKSSKHSNTNTETVTTSSSSPASSASEKTPKPAHDDSKASSADATVIADIIPQSSSVPPAQAADQTTEQDDTEVMDSAEAEEVVQVLEKEIYVAHNDAQLEKVVENLEQTSAASKEETVLEEQEIESVVVVEEEEEVESVQEDEEHEEHEQNALDTDVGADTPTTLVGDESDLAHTPNDTTSHAQEDKLVADKAKSLTSAVADKAQSLQEVSREAQHTELNAKAPIFQPTWMMQNGTSAPDQTFSSPARLSVDLSRQNIQQSTQQQYQQHSPQLLQQQQQQSSGQAVKIKARCRFWPNCTNKSCKFTHPSLPCRDPDNCSFGDRCNFIHPKDLIPRPPRKDKKDGARLNGRGKPRPGSTDSTSTLTDDIQVNYTGPK